MSKLKKMFINFLLLSLCVQSAFTIENFQHILENVKVFTSTNVQEKAAYGVIERIIPDKASYFVIKINQNLERNTFKVSSFFCYK